MFFINKAIFGFKNESIVLFYFFFTKVIVFYCYDLMYVGKWIQLKNIFNSTLYIIYYLTIINQQRLISKYKTSSVVLNK